VLKAAETGLTMFLEVRSAATGEPAASFVIEFALEDLATRRRLTLTPTTIRQAEAQLGALPPYGAPRSLSLEPPRLDLEFEAIRARVAEGDGSLLGGQTDCLIEAEDCDAYGFLREGEDLMFGPRRRGQPAGAGQMGPVIQLSDDGRRFGWAWMETRSIELARPRAGDVLRSVPVEISLQRKARHTRRWIFNTTDGRLAGIEDSVGVAFDIEARRAIEIPPRVRADLEARHVPEFA
jgi:hypothetical protein